MFSVFSLFRLHSRYILFIYLVWNKDTNRLHVLLMHKEATAAAFQSGIMSSVCVRRLERTHSIEKPNDSNDSIERNAVQWTMIVSAKSHLNMKIKQNNALLFGKYKKEREKCDADDMDNNNINDNDNNNGKMGCEYRMERWKRRTRKMRE